MHFRHKFLQKRFLYFFHGAFAPSFIWSRRPCMRLRALSLYCRRFFLTSATNCFSSSPVYPMDVANSTNIINSFADILVKTCIQLACLLPAGRMPPSGKLTVLNLLTGQNSGFSPRRGGTRCNDSRQTWLPTVTSVRLAVQNFTSIATGGTNAAPKYQKFPLFSKESPRRGDSLDRFLKILGALIRLNYHTFKFYMIRFSGYEVIAEKPRVCQLGQIFSVHPVTKTIRWIEK